MDISPGFVNTADWHDEYACWAELYTLRLACGLQRAGFNDVAAIHEAYGAVYGFSLRSMASRLEMLELLQLRLDEATEQLPTPKGCLFENLAILGRHLRLDKLDEEILAFCTIASFYKSLRKMLDDVGPLSANSLASLFAIALDRPPWTVGQRLREDSPLLRSALATLRRNIYTFQDKFSLVLGLPDALMRPHVSMQDLVSFALRRAPAALLSVEDYPHLTDEIRLLKDYLLAAIKNRLFGVNILFYGPPGVGKTQLVRAIADTTGSELYEVAASNALGDALSHKERHENYRFNQRFLAQQGNAMLVFDEAEEALQDRPVFKASEGLEKRQGKAWLNSILEGNVVPGFWVANSVDFIDGAVLRRFDYVLGVRNPPRSARIKAIRQALGEIEVSDQWLDAYAMDDAVSPAVVERAVRVFRTAGTRNPESCGRQLRRMVEGVVVAQGQRMATRYPRTEHYSLDYVNTGTDLATVARNLAERPRGRLLLHGPPGSGKTAFAHHLADALGRPMILRRASDLLSMWLGETEKNIARMFRQAFDDNAVLLLDEADSFLRDRRTAVRSWEVTGVNELLTQMECFEGIFLCATNFRETLDVAALRRFGMKIEFGYLTPQQCWLMFLNAWEKLNGGCASMLDATNLQQELVRLRNLTPGDFAAAIQHVEISTAAITPEALLKAIVGESRCKPDGNHTAIGFMSMS